MSAALGRGRRDRVWALVAVLLVAAAGVQAGLHAVPGRPVASLDSTLTWPAFVIAFAVAELVVVHVRWGRETQTYGFAEIPLVLGLLALSPVGLVTARVVGGGIALLMRRQSRAKVAFNLAQWWLCTALTVLLWRLGADLTHVHGTQSWVAALAATVAADAVATVAILVAMRLRGVSVDHRLALSTLWSGAAPAMANVCFALVTAEVLSVDAHGVWALVVVALFLGAAQRAHVGLQRRHDALERLSAFRTGLATTLDVVTVVEGVLAGTVALLEADECELHLSQAFTGSRLVFRRTAGTVSRWSAATDAPLPRPTARPARRWRTRTLLPELTEHLVEGATAIGSVTVRGRLGAVGGFNDDDRRLLRGVAQQATSALVNGQLADQLRAQVTENEHQALHDALTGLPNRVLFDRHVTAALLRGDRVAVMLMDLDRFKEVNDTLGHAVGDRLLREAGERIRLAAEDADVVARLGGDEFAVLLASPTREAAVVCAQAVREALLHPMAMSGVTLTIDASIGIALAPEHGEDIQSLLRHADVAMYRAKHTHAGVELYAAADDENTSSRLALVTELRDALRENQLELWYQPKASAGTGGVHSVEALVRWRHPTRGLVPPDEFIPVAEQTGLIDPLTDWVLDEALRQCRSWSLAGLELGVAVNISPRALRRDSFPSEVRASLQLNHVAAASLTLEITEGAMLEDPQRAGACLRELRAMGVRVSVDDFGTGYSSLAHLKDLPVDEVKIDKSFIRNLADRGDDEAIVEAIVTLVHRLRMTVVAEGVEDQASWDRLAALGCDTVQGYRLSRPVPADELAAFCAQRETRGLRLVAPAS